MKLSVHLVAWNGAKYIPYLFESLRKQTFKDWFLYIIDNSSKDNTVELIKKELENFAIPHKSVVNDVNNGFAGGHNQAYTNTNSEYFLLLNQDMYLKSDCLEKMVQFLDTHNEVGTVSPCLMRWDFNKINEGLKKTFSNQIDALGLKVFRNRRVIEWMTQEKWPLTNKLINQSTNQQFIKVFGASGAFPMLRRAATEAVAFSNGDFLDSDYHSYKEDVDLAYRFLSAGYKAYILLDTVAYHDRSGAGPKELSDVAALNNRKSQSSWVKYHSYKNHLMTMYKNEYWQNFILDLPFILWYELKKFVYLALFDRVVLKGLREVWNMRRVLRNKRQQITQKRKVSWRELRKWL